ncbi:Sororin Cell division cycle-associated protein 5-A [Triplophysa tibetana]|uniref:Sororin Cell division cycle-associated protein 5-A n=1 Tax=Triplophysa tibetana TaxID=1572043 RepID=A0A5A9P619_9TELE|nr:Sororin Cell division cycle-associated protein 5-A [Triplophysa tibetana]
MSNKTPRLTSRKSSDLIRKSNGESPPRRRSFRLSANDENLPSKVLAPPVAVKRSITVRKIAPRKTQAPSDSNKENVERLSEVLKKTSKTLTSSPNTSAAPKTAILSPGLPPSSPSSQPRESAEDLVWSQKVRRSYTRLSVGDKSFESPKSLPASSSSPNSRQTMFGFERLQTPEVIRKTEGSRSALQGSMSLIVGSFNISAADDSATNPPEVDLNIPGVCLLKKTRRKRVQQIKMSELDHLAAKMNAEFDEAENFELVVE